MTKAIELSFNRIVDLPKPEAFDFFFEKIWVEGKGLPLGVKVHVVAQGNDTKLGHTRQIALVGLQEQIIAVHSPDFFEYTVKSGPFPVTTHKGKVTFAPLEEFPDKSLVTWSAVFTPRFYLGGVLKKTVTSVFNNGLDTFVKLALQKKQNELQAKHKDEPAKTEATPTAAKAEAAEKVAEPQTDEDEGEIVLETEKEEVAGSTPEEITAQKEV